MPDGTTVVITEEAGSMTHVIVRSYARAVRLFAIVDSLIIILYVISGFYYAAVALLGPICGYHGAKNYVRAQTLTYVVFCFVNLCWRTAVFIMATKNKTGLPWIVSMTWSADGNMLYCGSTTGDIFVYETAA